MHILIIQGPNLNLIGTHSAGKKSETRFTLDKINRGIRRSLRNLDNGIDVNVKIIQTHDLATVITALQRNRNWANAIIIAPSSWGRYEYTLKTVLDLVELPVYEIYFSKPYTSFGLAEDSILSSICTETMTGKPDTVFISAINAAIRFLSQ